MRSLVSYVAKPLAGNVITAEYLNSIRLGLQRHNVKAAKTNVKGINFHSSCVVVHIDSLPSEDRHHPGDQMCTAAIRLRFDGAILDDPTAQFMTKSLRSNPIAKRIGMLNVIDSGGSPFPPVIAHTNMLMGWAMGCDALGGDRHFYVHLLHDVLCNKKVRDSVPISSLSAHNCKLLFGCDFLSVPM